MAVEVKGTFPGGAAVIVVVALSDAVVTLPVVVVVVVVLQSVAAEGETGVVVVVGDSDAAVEEVLKSVVTGGGVRSGLVTGVLLAVTDALVSLRAAVVSDAVPVLTGGAVGGGEEAVEAALGKSAGVGVGVVVVVVVVGGLVLVSTCALVAVLETVVLPVNADVCDTGAALEEVTVAGTVTGCVSELSLVVRVTPGGGVLAGVVAAAAAAAAVVVKSG